MTYACKRGPAQSIPIDYRFGLTASWLSREGGTQHKKAPDENLAFLVHRDRSASRFHGRDRRDNRHGPGGWNWSTMTQRRHSNLAIAASQTVAFGGKRPQHGSSVVQLTPGKFGPSAGGPRGGRGRNEKSLIDRNHHLYARDRRHPGGHEQRMQERPTCLVCSDVENEALREN